MIADDCLRIENASLRAWPAAEQLADTGWVIRISDGYTGRANSATLLHPEPDSISDVVLNRIEQRYRDRDRPVLLRLLSFAYPEEIALLLANRGYRAFNETLVMTRRLTTPFGIDADLRSLDLDQGLVAHARFRTLPAESQIAHRAILERIPGGLSFTGLFDHEKVVACGCSVVDGDLAGFFDIVTSPDHRRQGHARRMMCALLDRAHANGVEIVYLQVTAVNEPAIALYRSLGFESAYTYHYQRLDE